ncbi:MAG: exonuclease domain-containing protein [Clostridia bacterium]|nr:exonuclease domain-containing protein [Clostridia bacterium]
MNYIVLDMEWNQPVHVSRMIKKPVPLHGEIVEIGAVKVGEDGKVISDFKTMVAPVHYRKMNKRVSALTGITENELAGASGFADAYDRFCRWCGTDCVIITWGPDDIPILHSNIALHGLEDKTPDWYNLQVIFDDQIAKENRQMSLTAAMELVGEPALVAHDALNDALNTACILRHLDMKDGLMQYAELESRFCKKPPKEKEPDDDTCFYMRKWDMLEDVKMMEYICPVCGAQASCEELVSQNRYKSIARGTCAEGHEHFLRFKFDMTEDRLFCCSRHVFEMTEERRATYEAKRAIRGIILPKTEKDPIPF